MFKTPEYTIRNRVAAALLAVIVTAGCSTSAPVPPSVAPESEDSSAESILQRLRADHNVPSMAAIVVNADGMLDFAVVGVRRQGAEQGVERGDLYHLGSMGKAITATVIATLVEEGRLSWTDRPTDLFPELASSIHPGYRDVTLEQLLRHQGGTPYYGRPGQIAKAAARWSSSGAPRDQRRAFSVWLLQQKPHVAPGTKASYSNAGYAVAAAMAEAAADESWNSLLESRLAKLLGIRLVHGWPAARDERQPWGHEPSSKLFGLMTDSVAVQPRSPEESYQFGGLFSPVGDYSLSLDDYARFLQLHLAGLEGRDGLLMASTIRYLHSGETKHYGMGWYINEFDEKVVHTHSGYTGTFQSRVQILPEQGIAVAIAANSGSVSATKAVLEAAAALLRMYGGEPSE